MGLQSPSIPRFWPTPRMRCGHSLRRASLCLTATVLRCRRTLLNRILAGYGIEGIELAHRRSETGPGKTQNKGAPVPGQLTFAVRLDHCHGVNQPTRQSITVAAHRPNRSPERQNTPTNSDHSLIIKHPISGATSAGVFRGRNR